MSQINQTLLAARQRAAAQNLPYSGALTPQEAHQLLQGLPAARLVDVRSAAEWQFVGQVPEALRIEWKTYPGMLPNPHFIEQLKQQADPEAVLLFLCRTGGRSHEAAAAAAASGYSECYNVLEGFEGDRDAEGHRGTVNGWKAHQLPWQQS
ncbi:rhodanese-like domain-containing protein [Parachitinimonas caeni]|uniref:Rhodanese-like domain-containing protein n=1 Tax=Parachitinimonas caeni TaxID=3031301 RepID=A0ABT7DRH5_9NEIS|nr:rhodanese-like domain-containing protein [Parachitinimonas caeni]MDK2122659.1 rhodanese-like domain-containing protein [Parachitinimonas caeni]